ncbi:MAG: acyl-CoA dehydrogenase family protein [Actinobacteria bacterium]|nr:acyl-CoA dehydrogenase family protein [Actinomycetota bacterium]
MKLAWSAEDEAFRAELAAFLDQHAPPEAVEYGRHLADESSDGGAPPELLPDWARVWQATLFDHGWMVPGYPPELGGRNATPTQTLIYLSELAARDVPRSLHFPGYAIVGPSLLEFGNEEQRGLAPAAIRGDAVWCIGMSEPNAGSDLAGLQTRAVQDGDTFVVNGQKVWTSYAMIADRCMCYVRTDPDAPKHKGISVLMIEMDTPGIEVRPLRHITGAAEFAEVFFTDVAVPAAHLLGDVNDGWRITTGSLAHERGGLWVPGVARCRHTVDELVGVAKARGLDADPGIRREIAALYEEAASLWALGHKGFAAGAGGAEHSYMKLAYSELLKHQFEVGMTLHGPDGAVTSGEPGDPVWWRRFFASFAGTIAGGTSEIQRNIIAQRVLGLPRGA